MPSLDLAPRAIGQVLDGHPPFCLCRACDDASWEVEKQLLARLPPQTGTRLLPRVRHDTFTDGAGI